MLISSADATKYRRHFKEYNLNKRNFKFYFEILVLLSRDWLHFVIPHRHRSVRRLEATATRCFSPLWESSNLKAAIPRLILAYMAAIVVPRTNQLVALVGWKWRWLTMLAIGSPSIWMRWHIAAWRTKMLGLQLLLKISRQTDGRTFFWFKLCMVGMLEIVEYGDVGCFAAEMMWSVWWSDVEILRGVSRVPSTEIDQSLPWKNSLSSGPMGCSKVGMLMLCTYHRYLNLALDRKRGGVWTMDRRVTLQSRVIPLAALRSDGSLYHSM